MVEEDTTAFVETISAAPRDRKAERLERQATAAELKYRKAALRARLERDLSAIERGRDPADLAQLDLGKLQADLERIRQRSTRLREEAEDRRKRSERVVSHRLHFRNHYVDCSEEAFAVWLNRQRTRPVLVATRHGIRWWWFLDRFWWEDEGLGAGQLRKRVLQLVATSRGQRNEAERARSTIFDTGTKRSVLPESLLDDTGSIPPRE